MLVHIFGVDMSKHECGQSGDGTLKLTVSEEWTEEINFLYVNVNSQKLKTDQKLLGWVSSKMDVISLVTGF